MPKQEFKISENRPGQATRQLDWAVAGYLVVLSALLVLEGYYLHRVLYPTWWGNGIGLFIFQVLITFFLVQILGLLPLSHAWRYRTAFLGSFGYFTVWALIAGNLPSLASVPLALVGAFLGGLFATGFNERFWENNSPPSDWVQEEVYQRHLAVIGVPGAAPTAKRMFDIGLALFGLILSFPIWLLSLFLIWIEDPGPLLFVKNSVGKGGINFHQFKFRTMVRGAEETTGPVLARESDERVLAFGAVLRKTALDELPQMINILRGEMSFVGPRPQRTVLVLNYLDKIPAYAERHRVLPGLAGLAQVAGDYYLTPRQKLRYDRLYIRYASLGFDLKLIFLAFLLAFWYRWKKDWDGRLPRKLFRWGSIPKRM